MTLCGGNWSAVKETTRFAKGRAVSELTVYAAVARLVPKDREGATAAVDRIDVVTLGISASLAMVELCTVRGLCERLRGGRTTSSLRPYSSSGILKRLLFWRATLPSPRVVAVTTVDVKVELVTLVARLELPSPSPRVARVEAPCTGASPSSGLFKMDSSVPPN